MIARASRGGLDKQSSWLPDTWISRNKPSFRDDRGYQGWWCGSEMASV
jgi:hypothetical protein